MNIAMQGPTIGDFAGRVGKRFDVHLTGHRLALVLDAVQELPASARQGGSFRLEFLGPLDPMLTQGIFPFQNGGDRFDIFIVPVARDPRGTRYEAIFV